MKKKKEDKVNYNSYLINGELYVSVSTILNAESMGDLVKWALKKFGPAEVPLSSYFQFMKEVSSLGTSIHKFIEFDLKKLKLDAAEIPDEALPAIEQYITWKKDKKIKMIASERRCHSEKWRIAGTCDLVAEIDGELYVVDIKTGSLVAKAFSQLAAYKAFLCQEKKANRIPGIEKAKLAILSVHRDGEPVKLVTLEDYFNDEQDEKDQLGIFHCLRYIWAKRNLKSRRWRAVVKDMSELMNPLETRFKSTFKLKRS